VHWTRRQFLDGLACTGASLGLGLPSLSHAAGEPRPAYRLLFCYLNGGADQLLSLDPRNLIDFPTANPDNSIIQPAYDLVINPRVEALLQQTQGAGVIRFDDSKITFGPAIGRLQEHTHDLCVVRGLAMNTNTHNVGRRYMNTGRLPLGLVPRGNSLPVTMVASQGKQSPLPNLALRFSESYASNAPAFSVGNIIPNISTLRQLLKREAPYPVEMSTLEAIEAYVQKTNCEDQVLNKANLTGQFQRASVQGAALTNSDLAGFFDASSPSFMEVLADVGATPSRLDEAPAQAAVALQALTQNLSQAVSIQLTGGLDTHFSDWKRQQAQRLLAGYDLLGDIIKHLKKRPVIENGIATGESWLDRTLVVAYSEFGRTPALNSSGGRDHYPYGNLVCAGGPIAGNTLIGGSDDISMTPYPVNPITGDAVGHDDPGGVKIRPEDIHATLLHLMGHSYDHLEQTSPTIIRAMGKNA
jgi:uncharacterized protein (DUF1501 family)